MAVTPQWMVQGREAIHSRHGTVLSVAVTAQHRRAMRIARCRYIFVNSETPHQDFFSTLLFIQYMYLQKA